MILLRTSMVIETAERHLSSIDSAAIDGVQISSYLAQVAAITFCAEMEERVKSVVSGRLAISGDVRIANFISKTNEGMIRRMKRPDIAETVALFGEDCKDNFRNIMGDEDLAKYNNVIGERHLSAHGAGASVTLSEVKMALQIGEKILVAIGDSIV